MANKRTRTTRRRERLRKLEMDAERQDDTTRSYDPLSEIPRDPGEAKLQEGRHIITTQQEIEYKAWLAAQSNEMPKDIPVWARKKFAALVEENKRRIDRAKRLGMKDIFEPPAESRDPAPTHEGATEKSDRYLDEVSSDESRALQSLSGYSRLIATASIKNRGQQAIPRIFDEPTRQAWSEEEINLLKQAKSPEHRRTIAEAIAAKHREFPSAYKEAQGAYKAAQQDIGYPAPKSIAPRLGPDRGIAVDLKPITPAELTEQLRKQRAHLITTQTVLGPRPEGTELKTDPRPKEKRKVKLARDDDVIALEQQIGQAYYGVSGLERTTIKLIKEYWNDASPEQRRQMVSQFRAGREESESIRQAAAIEAERLNVKLNQAVAEAAKQVRLDERIMRVQRLMGIEDKITAQREAHPRFIKPKPTPRVRKTAKMPKETPEQQRKVNKAVLQMHVDSEIPKERRTSVLTAAEAISGKNRTAYSWLSHPVRWSKEHTHARVGPAIEGTLTVAFDKNGKVVPPGSKDVRFRLSPNAQWEYEVQRGGKEGVVRVPYWDTENSFKRSANPEFDELLRGEPRKAMSNSGVELFYPTVREKLVPRFNEPVAFTQGEMERKKSIALHPAVKKEEFIPLKGAAARSRLIEHPLDYIEVKLIRNIDGELVPATPLEWDRAHTERTDPLTGKTQRVPIDPSAIDTVRIPQKIQRTIISPEELQLKRNAQHMVAFRVPGTKSGFGKKATDRFSDWALIDPEHNVGGYMAEIGLGQGRLNDIVSPVFQAQQEEALRKRSTLAAMDQNRKTHDWGNPATGVASAGVAAAYYKSRNAAIQGPFTKGVNSTWAWFLHKHPKIKARAEDMALGDKDDILIPMKRGWGDPLATKVRDVKRAVRHPISSTSGTTEPGIDLGIRYRQRLFLRNGQEKIAERTVEKEVRHLTRILETRDEAQRAVYQKGIKARLTRWSAEPRQWNKDYENFDDYLTRTSDMADAVMSKGNKGYGPGTKSFAAAENLKRQVDEQLRKQEEWVKMKNATPTKVRESRAKNQVHNIWEKQPGPKEKPLWYRTGGGGRGRHDELVHVASGGGGGGGHLGRNLLIGGAVVGTAVGSHMAYHKYQMSKLPPEERESYINHITPGPITVPVPRFRATSHVYTPTNIVTNEFKLANRGIPTEWGVSKGEKTIWKGSLADRGYPKNAKLGLLGTRVNVVAGASAKSLIYDPEEVFNRKKTFKPAGFEPVILGKKLPIRVQIGKQTPIKLSRTNPNRLTDEDREKIIWAFNKTPEEGEVKALFPYDDKIHDMWTDDKRVAQIIKRYGPREAKRISSGQKFTYDEDGRRRIQTWSEQTSETRREGDLPEWMVEDYGVGPIHEGAPFKSPLAGKTRWLPGWLEERWGGRIVDPAPVEKGRRIYQETFESAEDAPDPIHNPRRGPYNAARWISPSAIAKPFMGRSPPGERTMPTQPHPEKLTKTDEYWDEEKGQWVTHERPVGSRATRTKPVEEHFFAASKKTKAKKHRGS